MKKTLIFAVMGMFLSVSAFAGVVVFQDGKTMVYHQGSEVNVDGKTTSRVLYDGILITVPKGQKVKIKGQDSEMGKNIVVSGSNLKGVEIAGKNVSSKGQATVSVSLNTLEVKTVKGNTMIEENGVVINSIGQGNTNQANKVQKTEKMTNNKQTAYVVNTSSSVNESAIFPEISDYVNEVAAQQSTQDVERPTLSQYSTSGD